MGKETKTGVNKEYEYENVIDYLYDIEQKVELLNLKQEDIRLMMGGLTTLIIIVTIILTLLIVFL